MPRPEFAGRRAEIYFPTPEQLREWSDAANLIETLQIACQEKDTRIKELEEIVLIGEIVMDELGALIEGMAAVHQQQSGNVVIFPDNPEFEECIYKKVRNHVEEELVRRKAAGEALEAIRRKV